MLSIRFRAFRYIPNLKNSWSLDMKLQITFQIIYKYFRSLWINNYNVIFISRYVSKLIPFYIFTFFIKFRILNIQGKNIIFLEVILTNLRELKILVDLILSIRK